MFANRSRSSRSKKNCRGYSKLEDSLRSVRREWTSPLASPQQPSLVRGVILKLISFVPRRKPTSCVLFYAQVELHHACWDHRHSYRVDDSIQEGPQAAAA